MVLANILWQNEHITRKTTVCAKINSSLLNAVYLVSTVHRLPSLYSEGKTTDGFENSSELPTFCLGDSISNMFGLTSILYPVTVTRAAILFCGFICTESSCTTWMALLLCQNTTWPLNLFKNTHIHSITRWVLWTFSWNRKCSVWQTWPTLDVQVRMSENNDLR